MSLKNLPNAIIPVLLCATATFSTSTLAQTVTAITSGDICAPEDVGSANKSIQNLRGNIVNTSATETVVVTCPLLTYDVAQNATGIVQWVVSNTANFDQSVTCGLREIESGSNDAEQAETDTLVPAESSAVLSFSFERALGSRLGLVCALPPSSSLGFIAIENSN